VCCGFGNTSLCAKTRAKSFGEFNGCCFEFLKVSQKGHTFLRACLGLFSFNLLVLRHKRDHAWSVIGLRFQRMSSQFDCYGLSFFDNGSDMLIPLTPVWAAYLVATHTPGMSGTQLQRQMGCSYKTAWYLLHRFRRSMVNESRSFATVWACGS